MFRSVDGLGSVGYKNGKPHVIVIVSSWSLRLYDNKKENQFAKQETDMIKAETFFGHVEEIDSSNRHSDKSLHEP